MVVGEAIGEGSAREETVVGETPSLAARLQALAPPGGILIAQSTRSLLGRLFELEPAGPLDLKGFDGEVSAWHVHGASSGQGRFEARRAAGLLPMVGRDRELAQLLEQWAKACAGHGQAVLLLGEAGIGKSRLLRSLCDIAAAEGGAVIRWQGSPFHGGSPLWPVAQELAGDPSRRQHRSTRAAFPPGGCRSAAGVSLVAALLGLAAEDRGPVPMAGAAQRHRLLTALRDRLLGLAGRQPLLLILEDAHWVDPTTLELARSLLDAIAGTPLFLVVSSRHDDIPALPPAPQLNRLVLNRLSTADIAAMIAPLVPGVAQRQALLDTIVLRTDGVPLFVEELTKALAERPDGAEHEVPASLHDTLMARLDRLLDSKEVAQVAACIGREVEHRLLVAVSDRPEADLRRSLDRLCEAELLFRRGSPPDAIYCFKHALVRDAAYESLLKSRRRTIHERVLNALEAGVLPAATSFAETAAHHAAAAELWAKALHYYGAAGKAAIERAAYAEGIALLAKALEAGAHHAGDTTAEVAMIDLRRARSWAFLAIGDTPRLMAELRDAESRAGRYGLARLSGQLRAQRAHVESIFGGHTRRAIGYGRDAGRIAASLRDAELASAARFVLGQSYWVAGDYRAAVAELTVDADAYRSGLRTAQIASSGTLAVEGLSVLGGCLGLLGRWDEALAHAAEAQAIAAGTGLPFDRVCAAWHLARTLLTRGDLDAAVPLLEQGVELGQRFGMRMMVLWNQAILGQARGAQGQLDLALGAARCGSRWLRRDAAAIHGHPRPSDKGRDLYRWRPRRGRHLGCRRSRAGPRTRLSRSRGHGAAPAGGSRSSQRRQASRGRVRHRIRPRPGAGAGVDRGPAVES